MAGMTVLRSRSLVDEFPGHARLQVVQIVAMKEPPAGVVCEKLYLDGLFWPHADSVFQGGERHFNFRFQQAEKVAV